MESWFLFNPSYLTKSTLASLMAWSWLRWMLPKWFCICCLVLNLWWHFSNLHLNLYYAIICKLCLLTNWGLLKVLNSILLVCTSRLIPHLLWKWGQRSISTRCCIPSPWSCIWESFTLSGSTKQTNRRGNYWSNSDTIYSGFLEFLTKGRAIFSFAVIAPEEIRVVYLICTSASWTIEFIGINGSYLLPGV